MMPPADVLPLGQHRQILPLAPLVAVLDSEPFSKPLPVDGTAVAGIEDVPQLVNQHVVEVEIPNRLRRPDQLPLAAAGGLPASTEHAGFDLLARLGGLAEGFDQV